MFLGDALCLSMTRNEMLSFFLCVKEVCRKTSTVPLRLRILVPLSDGCASDLARVGQQKWSPLQNSRSNALKILQVLCIDKQGRPKLLTPKDGSRQGEVVFSIGNASAVGWGLDFAHIKSPKPNSAIGDVKHAGRRRIRIRTIMHIVVSPCDRHCPSAKPN